MTGTTKATAREQARLQQELQERRRKERRILISVAVAVVVLVVGGGIGLQAWRTNRAPSSPPTAAAAAGAPIAVQNGRPLVFGRPEAPVKVTLYEDFHCSHCADFEEAYGPVLRDAEAAGKAAIELYPLPWIDAGSASAANALACAAEDGFGPAYYRGLFGNATLQWSDQQLTELAGLVVPEPPASFGTCVTSKAHQGWVQSLPAAAKQAGVTGTPTVFVDGQRVDLATVTPEALRTQIEQAAG